MKTRLAEQLSRVTRISRRPCRATGMCIVIQTASRLARVGGGVVIRIHFSFTLLAVVFTGICRVLLCSEFSEIHQSPINADSPSEAGLQFLQAVFRYRNVIEVWRNSTVDPKDHHGKYNREKTLLYLGI